MLLSVVEEVDSKFSFIPQKDMIPFCALNHIEWIHSFVFFHATDGGIMKVHDGVICKNYYVANISLASPRCTMCGTIFIWRQTNYVLMLTTMHSIINECLAVVLFSLSITFWAHLSAHLMIQETAISTISCLFTGFTSSIPTSFPALDSQMKHADMWAEWFISSLSDWYGEGQGLAMLWLSVCAAILAFPPFSW